MLLAMVLGAGLVVSGVVLADVGSDPSNDLSAPAGDGSLTTIDVAATGSASAQPDRVVVRLAVVATAQNATVARTNVAENVSAVRAALSDLGLADEEVRTSGYDLYQDERRAREERQPGEAMYRVRHQLTVETDDVEAAGAVIDSAVANGATRIYDVAFTLSPDTREELRTEALSQAMSAARVEAQTLASSANISLANVDTISTTGGARVYHEAALAATPTADSERTDIDAGPVSVTASVQVTYNASADGQ